ncbi:NAD-dependent epimerase/dehydratase family protein [Streptosporangium canum]|uniref:NAD-dependent epimerase/dehydratase family protein n=1 Tax=Streptosporangium canum TaxID=324952 RepID=UPI0033BDF344
MRPTYSPSVTDLVGGEKVPLCGDGLDVREWPHVDDHCRGIQAVLEKGSPRPCGGTAITRTGGAL